MFALLGLFAVSAKQFLTGASRAFDESHYKFSIMLLLRAEDAVDRLAEEVKASANSDVFVQASSLK